MGDAKECYFCDKTGSGARICAECIGLWRSACDRRGALYRIFTKQRKEIDQLTAEVKQLRGELAEAEETG